MKIIDPGELSNMAMVEGNETKYSIVIDDGVVKEWVGIGWLHIRDASEHDLKTLPHVNRGGQHVS